MAGPAWCTATAAGAAAAVTDRGLRGAAPRRLPGLAPQPRRCHERGGACRELQWRSAAARLLLSAGCTAFGTLPPRSS